VVNDDTPGQELEPARPAMTSTEKVWSLIEYLQDSEDEELAEAIPIKAPVGIVRGALAMAGDTLPNTPAELDEFLTQVGSFCLGLRSDGYAA
jgi:hypothetical protein